MHPTFVKAFTGVVSACVLGLALTISSMIPGTFKKNTSTNGRSEKTIKNSIGNNVDIIDDNNAVKIDDLLSRVTSKSSEIINIENSKALGIGINDSLTLVSKDDNGNLKYTFQLFEELRGNGAKILASDLDCDRFVVSTMAVYKQGKYINTIRKGDIRTNDLYDKYGEDIVIELNFNGYKDGQDEPVCKNIGWLNVDDFKHQNIKKNQTVIESDIAGAIIVKNGNSNGTDVSLEAESDVVEENQNIQEIEVALDNEENTKENYYTSENDYFDFGLNDSVKLFSI